MQNGNKLFKYVIERFNLFVFNHFHTSVIVHVGQIVVGGGLQGSVGTYLDSFDIHDEYTECKVQDVPKPLRGSAVTLLNKTTPLICGEPQDKSTNSLCWRLSKDGQWKSFPKMLERRSYFTLNSVGKYVIAIGGLNDGAEKYDPSQNQWTSISNLPVSLHSPCAVEINNTHLMINGGKHKQTDKVLNY